MPPTAPPVDYEALTVQHLAQLRANSKRLAEVADVVAVWRADMMRLTPTPAQATATAMALIAQVVER